jgi:hypothetical protein
MPPPGATPPPPPNGGYSAAPPPPTASGGGSQIDVGIAFKWAMAKFQQHRLVFIELAAVIFLLRLIQQLISTVVTNHFLDNCDSGGIIRGQNGNVIIGNCAVSFGTTIGIAVLLAIVFGVLIALAMVGLYRAALRTSKGETPALTDLVSTEHLGAFVAVAICYGLASFAGLALCIIPGIVVIFLFQFAPLYALDRGDGVGNAFGNSYRAVKANFVPVLLVALVNIVANILSGLVFGILSLIALPFAVLFTVHVYRQLNREPIAA